MNISIGGNTGFRRVSKEVNDRYIDVTSDDGKVRLRLILEEDNVVVVANRGKIVVDSDRAVPSVIFEKV